MIPAQFDYVQGGFEEGLAAVQVGKKYGFINRSGEMVIAPRFDMVFGPHRGLIDVSFGKWLPSKRPGHDFSLPIYQGSWGYVDLTGRWVLKPTK